MVDPLEFAVTLASQAGKLLLSYFDPSGITASMKPDRTVVTEADLAADKMITAAILQQYPIDEIISEESSHLVKNISSSTWVIDPLDGTTNFSLGLPIWGVSIARIVGLLPELGVLYFPVINELYTAQHNSGAFMNHKPIQVHAPDPNQPMSFFACCSRAFRYYDINIPYKPRILGSSAYSFCMVARGSALLAFDVTPKIWDLAAIWNIVIESGGVIAPFEGQSPFPISLNIDYRVMNFPTLAAATPDLLSMGQKKIHRKSDVSASVTDTTE